MNTMEKLNKEQLVELLISSDYEIRNFARDYIKNNYDINFYVYANFFSSKNIYYSLENNNWPDKAKAVFYLDKEITIYFKSSDISRPYITSLLNCIFEYNGKREIN